MTATAALPSTMETVEEIYFDVIHTAIAAHPRSHQKRIGPSEIGIPCDRCLGHKLAGTPEAQTGPAWKPAIGIAIHAQLDDWFTAAAALAGGEYEDGFDCETRVSVGEIDGVEITGSCDLFMPGVGVVIDHKCVGGKQLARYRTNGPSQQYRTQAHLYGRGFQRLGYHTQHVAIAFLPRDGELGLAHMWSEPYDEQIAIDALERATRISVNIRAMQSLDEDTALGYINGLPVDPACFSCPRYPGAPTKPVAENTAALLNL